jgi:hypothetical protein
VSGLLAGMLDGSTEVTLRRPPPLGRSLGVRTSSDGTGVVLLDGDDVVAQASSTSGPDDHVPDPVDWDEAEEAAGRSPGSSDRPFPTCFVCGPAREDGLRIFPGPVPGRNLVAATWQPDRSLAGPEGLIRSEFVWAALDCPGGFASGFPATSMLLGRLQADVAAEVLPGQQCVVLGWSEGEEGRKRFAGTAILDRDGTPLAVARATWISVST